MGRERRIGNYDRSPSLSTGNSNLAPSLGRHDTLRQAIRYSDSDDPIASRRSQEIIRQARGTIPPDHLLEHLPKNPQELDPNNWGQYEIALTLMNYESPPISHEDHAILIDSLKTIIYSDVPQPGTRTYRQFAVISALNLVWELEQEDAAQILIDKMDDENIKIAQKAINLLQFAGYYEDPEKRNLALDALMAVATNGKSELSQKAIISLAVSQDERILSLLETSILGQYANWALDALSIFRPNEQIKQILLSALNKHSLNIFHEFGDKAIRTLLKFGPNEVVEPLLKILETYTEEEPTNYSIRKVAIDALAHTQDPRATQMLCHILDQDSFEIRNATLSLAKIQDPSSIPYIIEALNRDLDKGVGFGTTVCLYALSTLTNPQTTVYYAQKMLSEPGLFYGHIIEILNVLKDLDDPQIVQIVSKYTNHEENDVREVALEVLNKVTPYAAN